MNFTIFLYFSLRDTFMHGSLGVLVLNPKGGGVGVLPYMAYTGTYRWAGYGSSPFCPERSI